MGPMRSMSSPIYSNLTNQGWVLFNPHGGGFNLHKYASDWIIVPQIVVNIDDEHSHTIHGTSICAYNKSMFDDFCGKRR